MERPRASPSHPRPNLPRGPLLWGLLVGSLAMAAYALTLPDYGLVSDEGNYLQSASRLINWFHDFARALGDGQPGRVLTPAAMAESWSWNRERIPHPPFSREITSLSGFLFHERMDLLVAYRLLGSLLAAALAGGVAAWGALRAGPAGGLVAGVAFLVMPRVFAHAHFADTDFVLSALFFFTLFTAAEAKRRPLAWAGLFWGLALATKFSAVLLPAALVPWLALFRRERLRDLPLFLLVAALTFALVNPELWADPAGYVQQLVRQNLGRRASDIAQLPTFYLGSIHVFRPPWHYPLVMLLLTLPPGLLLLAICGGASAVRRRPIRPVAAMALLVTGTFLAALELPSAPLHDDIRLMLPIFPFLALLAGLGAAGLLQPASPVAASAPPAPGVTRGTLRGGERPAGGATSARRLLGPVLVTFALGEPALALFRLHPLQASYFNALAGGVAGAHARGLEVTTMKEALNPDVYADLNRLLPARAILDGGPFLYEDLHYAQSLGWLRRDVAIRDGQPADYVLVVNRRGWFRDVDLALTRFSPALYQVTLEGVPVVALYRLR